MTAFVRTSLSFAATLSLAIVSTAVTANAHAATSNMNVTMKRGSFEHPRVRPNNLTTGSQGQSAGQNNTFCGKGDVFVIYDEDANGNRIPGTERYGCTD